MSEPVAEREIKYIANKDYVLREIMGEYMLIPTGELSMKYKDVMTVSESVAYLWQKLEEEKTALQLCELLLQEYDVDRETALSDINEMLDSMIKLEMLIALYPA